MVLASLSATHRDLELDRLEELGAGAEFLARDVVAGGGPVLGAVALATCNRVEVYLDVADAAHVPGAVDLVLERWGAGRELRLRTGADVPRHLFAVAAGLDSMVVGEREIAGQVRRAASRARERATMTPDLERLFAGANRSSRTVEAHAGLGALGRSVVGVALDLAEGNLPAWPQVRALLVGTGSYAGASLAALRARGCTDVSVYSASGRAEVFAVARDVAPVPEGGLVAALAWTDLVVACSGSALPVLTRDVVAAARDGVRAGVAVRAGAGAPVGPGAGAGSGLVVVDLSLHEDVEPQVRGLPGVSFVDLDAVRENAPAVRDEQLERAQAVVRTAVEEFEDSLAERSIDHAVVALRSLVNSAVEAELARLPTGGTVSAEQVERTLRRLAATLLHTPSVRARDAARAGLVDEYLTALRLVHGIEPRSE